MAKRMSNRDRIAKMAAEKAAEKKSKVAKKAKAKKAKAKKKPVRKTKAKAGAARSSGRMRLVWVVCDHTGNGVKSFDYPERDKADAEAAKRTESKGKPHFVKSEKVPMEEEE